MTLQLELEPTLADQIQQLANQTHSSPEEYILELLRREAQLKTKPAWVGMGNSGRSDLSSRTKELLFETMEHPSNDQ
jgi:hypothetical protein